MDREYKVLVLVIPRFGHIFPLGSVVNELTKNNANVQVFFTGNEADREIIEATGAKFVPMHIDIQHDHSANMNELRHNFPMDKMFMKAMDVADELLPKLVELVEREKFDLVVYDFVTMHGRWLKGHLNSLKKSGKFTGEVPRFAMFSPSLMLAKDIYPNKAEPQFYPAAKMTFKLFFGLILLFIRYAMFCWKFGLKFENMSNFTFHREELNLCSVVPEFQPRSHLFEKRLVFVGACACEEIRGSKKLEEPLKSFLEPFEPSNPTQLSNLKVDAQSFSRKKFKLIYASFGTVFNEDIKPFLDIIDAFNSLEQSESNQFRLLLSTGDKTYAKFQELINKASLKPQDNILIMSQVPQLEVLKRASVFINHSGQNSASESIHFGVPMICIPVYGDQPPVAYRCADELGLGVRIPYDDVSAARVREALLEILTDKSYLERAGLFAQVSRKYDGPKIASSLITQYLQLRS